MHCKDTILRTQNNWPYSKLIPNSGSYLYKFETTDYGEESQIKEKLEMSVLYLLASHVQA